MKTIQILEQIQARMVCLARGEASDHNEMTEMEYEEASRICYDLARYLDSMGESYAMASDPECTGVLAKLIEKLV